MQACVWGELWGYLRIGPVHRCEFCESHMQNHMLGSVCGWHVGRRPLCQRRVGWSSHLADRAMMTASTGLCVPGTRATQEVRRKTGMRKSQRFLWVSFQGTRSDLCLPLWEVSLFFPLFSLSDSLDETPGQDGGTAVVTCARLRCQGWPTCVEATCLVHTSGCTGPAWLTRHEAVTSQST